jgi:hypothetical protein
VQPIYRTVNYSLECVWTPSASGLSCKWIERDASDQRRSATAVEMPDETRNQQRKVA